MLPSDTQACHLESGIDEEPLCRNHLRDEWWP